MKNKPALISSQEKVKIEVLRIKGMHCAGCAANIERSLKKITGIIEASVNFATEKACIKWEPRNLKLSDIKNAIIKMGFTPVEAEEKSEKEKNELAIMARDLIFAAAAVIPLFYIAMVP
ncbi:MAG: heavy-metal-associated domain-containing protein, partial [Spirochaetaceae bacterium]|nr:heavy-metal-associated domain-containing protein [Spirochaetaceae bacterium]